MDIQTIRRERFRDVIEKQGGAASASKRLGWTMSYIGQLIKGYRPITEKTARQIERKLLLKERALDAQVNGGAPPFEGVDHGLLSQAILAVAAALETTDVRLDPVKQADLISVVYEHAITAGSISPRFVEQMVRMAAR